VESWELLLTTSGLFTSVSSPVDLFCISGMPAWSTNGHSIDQIGVRGFLPFFNAGITHEPCWLLPAHVKQPVGALCAGSSSGMEPGIGEKELLARREPGKEF
jgi:hypothetical protein